MRVRLWRKAKRTEKSQTGPSVKQTDCLTNGQLLAIFEALKEKTQQEVAVLTKHCLVRRTWREELRKKTPREKLRKKTLTMALLLFEKISNWQPPLDQWNFQFRALPDCIAGIAGITGILQSTHKSQPKKTADDWLFGCRLWTLCSPKNAHHEYC